MPEHSRMTALPSTWHTTSERLMLIGPGGPVAGGSAMNVDRYWVLRVLAGIFILKWG
jgi:hypothetical protein